MRTTYVLWGIALLALAGMAEAGDRSEVFDEALYFDGVDDYVWTLPNVADASTGTIELWARPEVAGALWSAGGNPPPDGNQDFSILGYHGTAQGFSFGIVCRLNWCWAESGQSPPLYEWTHVAATWGPDGSRLYFDGDLVGTFVDPWPMRAYAMDVIGSGTWGFLFRGAIDEVRFWSVARTQEEIQGNMSDLVDPTQVNLIAYYRFDALENLGVGADGADDVRDLTPNGNHGDAEGGVQVGTGETPVAAHTWGSVKALFR